MVRSVGLTGLVDCGCSAEWSTEDAPLMSLEWLGTGCCAGCRHMETTKTRASDACREEGGCGGGGGARIQLRGLDIEQLKGSLVVLYAPDGNSCLLLLVGNG